MGQDPDNTLPTPGGSPAGQSAPTNPWVAADAPATQTSGTGASTTQPPGSSAPLTQPDGAGAPPTTSAPTTAWASPPGQALETTAGSTLPPIAGFGRRVMGWLVDWLLIGAVLQLVLGLLVPSQAPWHTTTTAPDTSWSAMLAPDFWSLGLTVLNGLILAALNRDGQTPGRRWAKTRLVREDGTPLSGMAAAPRYLLHVIDDLVLGLGWWLLPLVDRRTQTVADKLAHSVVVDLRDPSTLARSRMAPSAHLTDPYQRD